MSLDKAILNNKEWRELYRGAKSISYHCRNHGKCNYCKSNRLFKYIKQIIKSKYTEDEE